jgi:hypothetical protein
MPLEEKIDIAAARDALTAISTTDPRETALEQLREGIKAKIADGASVKEIAFAIAPHLGGDEKWLARRISALRARRGGGRPPKSSKPAQAGGAEPATKPPRTTLRLAKPSAANQAAAGEGA